MKITLLTGKTFDIEKAIGFPIKVIKSASSKRLTLRIDSKERIPILSIPRFCSSKKAVEFVHANEQWIENSLSKIPEQKPFESGLEFSFFGQELTIKHDKNLKSGVFIENSIMHVSGDEEFLNRRIKDFIRKYAKDELYKRSKKKAIKIGCTLNEVFIKDTKSRWGSCSSNNNINYTWRIALAPEFVIDYLIAHEVSHLKHQDHSAKFWKCVESLCPDYKEGRSWLKVRGKDLYLYN